MVDLKVRSHQKSIYKYILIISMLKAFCLQINGYDSSSFDINYTFV